MKRNKLSLLKEEYAKLIVNVGLRFKPNSIVKLDLTTDDLEFNSYLVEQCYKAKASRVLTTIVDNQIEHLNYLYGTSDELQKVYKFQHDELKYLVDNKASFARMYSHNYNVANNVSDKKFHEVVKSRRASINAINIRLIETCNWTGFSVPNVLWAKKLFPNLTPDKGIEKLWYLIFKCCHIELSKSIDKWKQHNLNLSNRANYLDNLKIKYLHYYNKKGTDLTVGLISNYKFIGGDNHKLYNPNIPSEEVFASPNKWLTNGIVYSSKPLVIEGKVVDNFALRFKDGKVVEILGNNNINLLRGIVNFDKNSCYLGECALVPFSSPINKTGLLFFDSLYDENACCHLAIGCGFKFCVKDAEKYSINELDKIGLNFSSAHLDFMIGTKDLNIDATLKDGRVVAIFKNGEWAF